LTKRLAAGQLNGDSEKPDSHDVSLFDHWANQAAKCTLFSAWINNIHTTSTQELHHKNEDKSEIEC